MKKGGKRPVDIHNRRKRPQDSLEDVGSSQLPSEDTVAIQQFSDTLRAHGMSLGRIKCVYHLKASSEKMVLVPGSGSLEQADEQDRQAEGVAGRVLRAQASDEKGFLRRPEAMLQAEEGTSQRVPDVEEAPLLASPRSVTQGRSKESSTLLPLFRLQILQKQEREHAHRGKSL